MRSGKHLRRRRQGKCLLSSARVLSPGLPIVINSRVLSRLRCVFIPRRSFIAGYSQDREAERARTKFPSAAPKKPVVVAGFRCALSLPVYLDHYKVVARVSWPRLASYEATKKTMKKEAVYDGLLSRTRAPLLWIKKIYIYMKEHAKARAVIALFISRLLLLGPLLSLDAHVRRYEQEPKRNQPPSSSGGCTFFIIVIIVIAILERGESEKNSHCPPLRAHTRHKRSGRLPPSVAARFFRQRWASTGALESIAPRDSITISAIACAIIVILAPVTRCK